MQVAAQQAPEVERQVPEVEQQVQEAARQEAEPQAQPALLLEVPAGQQVSCPLLL